eukprot:1161037-Pelagomonas_calceolata.AAC.8
MRYCSCDGGKAGSWQELRNQGYGNYDGGTSWQELQNVGVVEKGNVYKMPMQCVGCCVQKNNAVGIRQEPHKRGG